MESTVRVDHDAIENEHLKIELSNGLIRAITLKKSERKLFEATAENGVNEIAIWKDDGCICEIRPRDFFDNATLTARSKVVSHGLNGWE